MNTSVDLTITDQNASSTARNIAGELDKVVTSADAINSAFDPKFLEDYSKELGKLTDQFSKLYKQQNENNKSQETASGGISRSSSRIQSAVSGAGSTLTQASGGDLGGAGITGLGTIAKVLGGGVSAVLGGVIATAIAGNALSKQYEPRAKQAGELASMQGLLSGSLKENDKALEKAMQDTVDSVSKYGKTYEEGIAARKAFLRSGGKNLEESEAAAYSLAYKDENYEELSSFEGILLRYGQKEGLKTTEGLLKDQGLEDAQFGEVMRGIEDIFTGFLSQGIIKDVTEIASNQEFLSRAGETFQGGLGVQKAQTLNQVVAGVGDLQSQEDMIWYQAGKGLKGAGDLWETKTAMEKEGFSPKFFELLMAEYDKLGYDEKDAKLSFQRKTGMGEADTNTIFGLEGSEEIKGKYDEIVDGKGETTLKGETTQTGMTENVENIKQDILSSFGETAFKAKAVTIETGAEIISNGELIIKNFSEKWKKRGEVAETNLDNQKVVEVKQQADILTRETGDTFLRRVKDAPFEGVEKLQEEIRKATIKGVRPEDIQGAIGEKYSAYTKKGSLDGMNLSTGEQSELLTLIRALIEATDKTTAAVEKPLNVRGYVE